MASLTHKRQRPDSDDDEIYASFIFKTKEYFARYLIIESANKDKPITSLSSFVIKKQKEALIGTAKSVKKLKKNKRYLLRQLEKVKLKTTFFNFPVEVSEHKTLNSSKGIIRDRALKAESVDNIREYLQEQGVTAVKRFKVRKGHEFVDTNTFCLHSILCFHQRHLNFLSNNSSLDVRAKSSEIFQLPQVWSS